MCDQIDDVIALGTYVVNNIRRCAERLEILQKKFPKDIANIILQYNDCYKFIIEQIEFNYWVRIMPILTSQQLYTHEIAFTKSGEHYIVMSTIRPNVVRVSMIGHIVDHLNDWVDETDRRLLLNRIEGAADVMCAICQQLFPRDQARLLGHPRDNTSDVAMMCMQHNDHIIQMMYIYENTISDII